MKVAIVNVIICASSATVPNNPANIVVISNDQASAEKLSAPEMANFQNGFSTEYFIFIPENTGHVSFNNRLFTNMYRAMMRNCAVLVNDVAHGAPTSPHPEAYISPQLNNALIALASTPIHTPGPSMFCVCKYFVNTLNKYRGNSPGINRYENSPAASAKSGSCPNSFMHGAHRATAPETAIVVKKVIMREFPVQIA